MPRSGKLPVLNLLTGQKSAFFAPQGRFFAPIHVKLGTAKGHMSPLSRAKFHANRCTVWERGPKMAKISTFLVESPRRGEPFDWFLQLLWTFIRPTNYSALVFHIWRNSLHRLRSYCGETARRSFSPKFSVHPVGKTMRWIKRHLFNGLDVLYHHAKFGEDRTTRAGSRCENVVFVSFYFFCHPRRSVRCWSRGT